MAEITDVNLDEVLRATLDETPWIEDKFAAIHGVLVAIGRGEHPDDPLGQTRLFSIGDSEFADWRLALHYETEERLPIVYRSYDLRRRVYRVSTLLSTLSHDPRELSAFVPEGQIIWTRSGDGLLGEDVARTLARETGSLTLSLSKSYVQSLELN